MKNRKHFGDAVGFKLFVLMSAEGPGPISHTAPQMSETVGANLVVHAVGIVLTVVLDVQAW